jgi:hypothetical protein
VLLQGASESQERFQEPAEMVLYQEPAEMVLYQEPAEHLLTGQCKAAAGAAPPTSPLSHAARTRTPPAGQTDLSSPPVPARPPPGAGLTARAGTP